MPAPVSQASYRDNLLRANRAVIDRIRAIVAPVSANAMLRRPPNGGWSIAEVLEHLIVSADSYLGMLRPIVEREKGRGSAGDATWKPTLMGGLLVGSFRSPRKRPAPRIYQPGPTPRAQALEEFIKRQEQVGRLLSEAGALDWRGIRVRSPVISLIRMNLGDALTVLVVHAERHAGQIERVKAATTNGRES